MNEKPTAVELMLRVMESVQAVRKADRNTEQGYNFRGIDATVNAVGPALREHGVLPVPVLHKAAYRDVLTSRGKPSRECTVEVAYRFYGPAGDFVEVVVPGESMDFGDKGTAKAMSVAYRIALLQALCIPTDEPDADAQSYEREAGPAQEWQAARPPTAEQVAVFEGLKKEVSEATAESMREVGGKAATARDGGLITPVQYQQLNQQARTRLDELGAA